MQTYKLYCQRFLKQRPGLTFMLLLVARFHRDTPREDVTVTGRTASERHEVEALLKVALSGQVDDWIEAELTGCPPPCHQLLLECVQQQSFFLSLGRIRFSRFSLIRAYTHTHSM